jgi:tetratricopeptide (TPR) repeat protein
MAKTILTIVTAVLLGVLVGCRGPDTGASQILPRPTQTAEIAAEAPTESETDIVEQMMTARSAYEDALKSLAQHYANTGNHLKLAWAQDELKELGKIHRYNYIIEAAVAGPNLRARQTIQLADYMYEDARRLERRARRLVVINNENLLRTSLNKYNDLIKMHPTSDKIDDAAYRAAGIHEDFKDYTLALLYYQRAYQWDSNTPHPAKYKRAFILDQHMHRRAEALDLYRQAVKEGRLAKSYMEFAQERIRVLSEAPGGKKEVK